MSRIKGKDTKPEIIVRRLIHKMGIRFRLHRKELPGKPDIVLPRYNTIIFINGCFWHRHPNCQRSTIPSTNIEYWEHKLIGNIKKDEDNIRKLQSKGWKVLVIWECETKNQENLIHKIKEIIGIPP